MKATVAANSARAGVIGLLSCCRCLYPIHHYETETMHDEACPAHAMTLSARGTSSQIVQVGGWYVVSLDIDTPSEIVSASERFARGQK